MIRVALRIGRGVGKPVYVLGSLLGIVAVWALTPTAFGAAPRSELSDFLNVLRQRGYADFTADYLQARKDDPALPADVRETWDVEMANSLWLSSSQTNNEKEAERRRTAAQGHLEAFQKEHPKHPAVAEVMVTWATKSLDDGAQRIQMAKLSAGEAEKEVHLNAAKILLADASTRLTKALETFKAQQEVAKPVVAAAPNPGDDDGVKKKAEPEEKKLSPAEEAALDLAFRISVVRFQLALVDYWMAQTFDEAQAAERAAKFKSAAEVFTQVHNANRTEFLGLIAHYWTARVSTEAKADEDTIEEALEIIDEVLTVAPDTIRRGEIDDATLSLIGDALVLRLQLLAKSKQEEMAAQEAGAWLKNNDIWKDSTAYQGIAIEWVKVLTPNLDKVRDPKVRFETQKAMLTTLTRISRGRGPYQREAANLLAKVAKHQGGGNKGQGAVFEESLAAAEAAFAAQQWASAVSGYKRAAELLGGTTVKLGAGDKQKHEKHITERLAQADVQIAYGLARDNQLDAATETAERVIRENPKSPAAPAAAALAMQTLQVMAVKESDKAKREPVMARWQALAERTLNTWPHSPEADEARFVLGIIALERNDGKQAVDRLTSVTTSSPRYSAAMLSAGRYSWRRYREEMAKPEADRKPALIQLFRESALKWISAGITAQRPLSADAKPEDRDKDRQQRSQLKLLLAEVQTACGKTADAQATYQEMITAGLSGGDKIDPATMQALAAAFKSNFARGDFDKASELAVELGKRAGDQPQINGLLVNVLKYLVHDLRKAEAAETEAEDGDNAAAKKTAAEGVAAARKRTGNLLAVISKQQQHSTTTLVFVADNCIRVGMKNEGQTLYQRILDDAAKSPEIDKELETALTGIRARMIGLLVDKRQYADALNQIDVLLEKYPKALDLLVQKGKILQAWSKVDPSHYSEAVGQWNTVRTMLAGMNPKPPEYYEAIYNTAECLVIQSQRDKKPDSASQAEKLLAGTLVLDPKLNGPDTVAKFKALLKRAATLQGR